MQHHLFGVNLTIVCLTPVLVDGGWSAWAQWSQCSGECDSGQQHRQRDCTDPSPQWGGQDCRGARNQSETCKSLSVHASVFLCAYGRVCMSCVYTCVCVFGVYDIISKLFFAVFRISFSFFLGFGVFGEGGRVFGGLLACFCCC